MTNASKKTTIFILVAMFVVTMCFSFLVLPKKAYGQMLDCGSYYVYQEEGYVENAEEDLDYYEFLDSGQDTNTYTIDDTEDTQDYDYIDDTEDTQDYEYSVKSLREIIIQNMTVQDCGYNVESVWEIIYPSKTLAD